MNRDTMLETVWRTVIRGATPEVRVYLGVLLSSHRPLGRRQNTEPKPRLPT